jgi:hypothetical protein
MIGSDSKAGVGQSQIYLIIAFIIFLILVIIGSRILNNLNDSIEICQLDEHVNNSKSWVKWLLGISTTAMVLSFIIFIVLFFVK